MSRISRTFIALALLTPALAQAQRPANTMNTTSAQLYLTRASGTQVAAEKAKLFEQALGAATQGVQQAPTNSKTWFVLGAVYAAMGDAAGADSAFDKAEQMWPDYKKETEQERLRAFAAASNKGVLAIQQNDYAAAAAALEGAAKVYDKRPTALLNLGSIYARQNKREEAITAYRG